MTRPLRLDDAWAPALEELLLDAPHVNLFLLGYADALPLKRALWYGVPDRGLGERLDAVCLLLPGRLLVPYARTLDAAGALGAFLRPRHRPCMLVGPRDTADALWDAFAHDAPVHRRYDQRLYRLAAPPADPAPRGFRKAVLADLDVVAEQARAMEFEDLGRWPDASDRPGWVRGIKRRIDNGQTWVIEEAGELVFQIHVGTVVRWGAQVGGTYVPPAHRGRGLGLAGMHGLAWRLLPGHRELTLHVNEANAPAVRTYVRAGWQPDLPMRLLTVPEDG